MAPGVDDTLYLSDFDVADVGWAIEGNNSDADGYVANANGEITLFVTDRTNINP